MTHSLTLTRPRGAFAPKNKMRTPYSTSQNSDLNHTSFLGEIRPKSDQKSGKNQTLFHNLTTLTLLNVPAGINVPYSYSEQIVKYSTFAEKSDFCWPIQTFLDLFSKKSPNSDQVWPIRTILSSTATPLGYDCSLKEQILHDTDYFFSTLHLKSCCIFFARMMS